MNHSSMKVFEICGSRERAELQWLQDPSQNNLDNLNSVTCETSKPLRKNVEIKIKGMSLKQIRNM